MTNLLRLEDVVDRVEMSRAWIYAQLKAGRFPPGIKIGQRARRWTEKSIQDWIASRAGA